MHRYKSTSECRTNSTSPVGRAHSTLSVSGVDYYLHLPVNCPPSSAVSTVTLTPGKIRNIDQDMETLRASRQDNPFIQQVIASRESLIDSLDEDSDDVNLMAKELSLDLDLDPMSLPEMHEHLIRSPPPTTWPKSQNFKAFQFPEEVKGKKTELKPKHSSWDGSETSPLKSFSKSHHFHSLRSSAEDSVRLMAED